MKKLLITLICALMAVSCRETDINGKLDGMWQLMEISKGDESSFYVKEDRIYYSFKLDLMSIRRIGSKELLARFNHVGDSLQFYDIRDAAANDVMATLEELSAYGLSDLKEHFSVEELSSSRMVLRSKYSTLSFRKF